MTAQGTTNDDIMKMLADFAGTVDKRFDKIDRRFEKIDERFEAIDQRFDKMFIYNEKRFAAIEQKLENMATKDDIRRLESVIDGYAGKIDEYAAEMAAMQHKIDRLERMIFYLADKANIPRDSLEMV